MIPQPDFASDEPRPLIQSLRRDIPSLGHDPHFERLRPGPRERGTNQKPPQPSPPRVGVDTEEPDLRRSPPRMNADVSDRTLPGIRDEDIPVGIGRVGLPGFLSG